MYYNNLNRQQEDDDLKFIPLNIKEPFLNKDSNWFPIVNMNSPNISSMANNFALGFANPMPNENIDENFLKTIDYIPSIKYSYTDEENFDTYDPNNMLGNTYNSNNTAGSGYISTNVLSSNQSNNPNSGMNNPNNSGKNVNLNAKSNLEYPSETNSEELHSYNKECNKNKQNNINPTTTTNSSMRGNYSDVDNIEGTLEPLHMEILREFDLGNDYESTSRDSKDKEINEILKKMEDDHGFILGTLKIYRIPYPIASLLVKKIIKLTLEYSNKERGE